MGNNQLPRIITDFDGVFSRDMIYDGTGKFAKSFGFGIKHAFEILTAAGFEPPLVITGDTSKVGVKVSENFLHNIPHELVSVDNHNKLEYIMQVCKKGDIYIGDDIYDIQAANGFLRFYSVKSAPQTVSKEAEIIFDNWVDCAAYLIEHFTEHLVRTITKNSSRLSLQSVLKMFDKKYVIMHTPVMNGIVKSLMTEILHSGYSLIVASKDMPKNVNHVLATHIFINGYRVEELVEDAENINQIFLAIDASAPNMLTLSETEYAFNNTYFFGIDEQLCNHYNSIKNVLYDMWPIHIDTQTIIKKW